MTYRITFKFGKIELGECPPSWITDVFPTFDGWPVSIVEENQRVVCIVAAPDGVEPVANPLLNIELL